jgi:hypothetical protein
VKPSASVVLPIGVGGGGTSLLLVVPLVSLDKAKLVLVLGLVEVLPVKDSEFTLEVGCATVVVV